MYRYILLNHHAIFFLFEKLFQGVLSRLRAIKYWKLYVYVIWTTLLGTLNSIIIYCKFTLKMKSKKSKSISFTLFLLLYGLNWNDVFAFLKSLFTINVTQYMKRKLSNTQCTKTTSKMNTIGGWKIKYKKEEVSRNNNHQLNQNYG